MCEHQAFCVTSSALFRRNSGRFQSFLLDNLLGPPFQVFSDNSRQFQAILGFFGAFPGQKPRLTKNKEG